tara:strand:+ start:404 stop:538 length:135 start_codon:yes stop_codon:yes gene_type:complete
VKEITVNRATPMSGGFVYGAGGQKGLPQIAAIKLPFWDFQEQRG